MENRLSVDKSERQVVQGMERDLIALSFKVPRRFRHWFKTEAAIRGVTMTELLIAAVASYIRSNPLERSKEPPDCAAVSK
jgi:hypothetical protein